LLAKSGELFVGWDSALWMFCAEATRFPRISIGTVIREMHISYLPSKELKISLTKSVNGFQIR
jgi:hypothetical protein